MNKKEYISVTNTLTKSVKYWRETFQNKGGGWGRVNQTTPPNRDAPCETFGTLALTCSGVPQEPFEFAQTLGQFTIGSGDDGSGDEHNGD